MSEERTPNRRPEEPWRDLPGDPWLRPGTLRVEREGRKGKSVLVAIVVSDPGNPGPGTGPWLQHWMMQVSEDMPLDVKLGGELEIRWNSSNTGTAAQLQANANHIADFTEEFCGPVSLEVRTIQTQVITTVPVPPPAPPN